MIDDDAGIKPMPRRDHNALLIRNNEYMLIYGGKNDLAFQYRNSDLQNFDSLNSQRKVNQCFYEEITSSSMDDIMLFNLQSREWTAVAQRGWRPDARWSAGLCYSESQDQLYLFGGTGARGSCRVEVYCCDLSANRSSFKLSELQNQVKDVEIAKKRMLGQFIDIP